MKKFCNTIIKILIAVISYIYLINGYNKVQDMILK